MHYEPSSLLELTDPRDYIFCAKNGGLVVSDSGIKTRVPYCMPFVDVVTRSSIEPVSKERFSKTIIEANIGLHAQLESLDHSAAIFYPESILTHIGLDKGATINDMLKMCLSLNINQA